MFKILLLIIVLLGLGGVAYWYGYNNGKADAQTNANARSLENTALQYVDKMKTIEVQYRDKDGNIVIPKVKWDEMHQKP